MTRMIVSFAFGMIVMFALVYVAVMLISLGSETGSGFGSGSGSGISKPDRMSILRGQ